MGRPQVRSPASAAAPSRNRANREEPEGMNTLALIDANHFYVACERVFNPRLEGRPVVVWSNNGLKGLDC